MEHNREQAKKAIERLVEQFKEQYQSYHKSTYDETTLRVDFINKFFAALGWDVTNEDGRAEHYREVLHEDKLKIGKTTKAPDYGFRLSGSEKRLFFVEAKKPAVPIKTDKAAAYQLRRYGRSAQTPVSILTNFEEFVIYDCSKTPSLNDSAGVGRIKYLRYEDYIQEFDFIYDTFSKEAVLKGRFDKYVQSDTQKRGSVPLDKEFVESLNIWRKYLAVSIARNNKQLNEKQLNYAVQQTIDRLIFLRFCEDRAVEPYGNLKSAATKGDVYKNLLEIFKIADDKYNSGLFDFEKDTITQELKIDNKVIKNVVNELYPPKCEYEFSVMPVEILGNAYEQFLGKVIRITARHSANIDDKPEVRKAGGVYYTPQYIVDYIVAQTVGELVKGKTPKEIEKIKIIDPACGSGSFLLGVFKYLLNYHTDWYNENGYAQKKNGGGVLTPEGRLTTAEKKKILLNNVYGVDLDENAVEVSKLSLLLKTMEGETAASINQQLQFFHDRVLPDLDKNILCGNSLIGHDFFDGELALGSKEIKDLQQKIKPFDWETSFSKIFKQGGFDVVVGNPPYVRIQHMKEYSPESVEFFKKIYYTADSGNYDLYVLFVDKVHKIMRKGGITGFILPNKFFNTDYGLNLRQLITSKNTLHGIIDFGHHQIFESATTYCCILFLKNEKNKNIFYLKTDPQKLNAPNNESQNLDSSILSSSPWNFYSNSEISLNEKIASKSIKLIDLPTQISRGSSSGDDKIFILEFDGQNYKNGHGETVIIEEAILKYPIFASDFGRYFFKDATKFRIIFPYYLLDSKVTLLEEKDLSKKFPKTYHYLNAHKEELLKRKQSGKWYSYSAARNLALHATADIVIPLLANKGLFSVLPTNKEDYTLMASGGFSISVPEKLFNTKYILGLLNSKLLFWTLERSSNIFRGGWITCTKQYFSNILIKTVDNGNRYLHDKIVKQVQIMLSLKIELESTKTPTEQQHLESRIEYVDRKIDELVYELYELTDEEIQVIAGSTL